MNEEMKHYGSNLEVVTSAQGAISKPAADYGMFLLAIPVVATMLIWFWVSRMNLFQSPGDTMALIMLATVIGTAVVAGMEASRAGMKSDTKLGTYSSTAWFFIITLMWIIGYPVYLFKRKDFGLANRLHVGILVAAIFVGSWVIMYSAIEDKKAEVVHNLQQMQQQFNSLGRVGQNAAEFIKHLSSDKSDSARLQIQDFAATLDLYKLELGRYPTTDEGLKALVEQPSNAEGWNGPYLKKK